MMTGCELSLSSVVPISVYSAQPSSERHLRPLRFVSHHFEHKNPEEVQPWEIFCYVGGLQKTNLRTIESGSSKYIGPRYNRGITTCVIEFSFLLPSIFISVPLDLAVAFGVFIAMKTIGLHHCRFLFPEMVEILAHAFMLLFFCVRFDNSRSLFIENPFCRDSSPREQNRCAVLPVCSLQ